MQTHRTTPDPVVPGWRVTVPPPAAPVEPRDAPTLSVLITYYRGRAGDPRGRRCPCSSRPSGPKPSEIVICDDGSPDDLEAALGPLRTAVKIVRKENGGTGSALNAAVRASSGEYVVQLDQDDAFLPRRLEAITATLVAPVPMSTSSAPTPSSSWRAGASAPSKLSTRIRTPISARPSCARPRSCGPQCGAPSCSPQAATTRASWSSRTGSASCGWYSAEGSLHSSTSRCTAGV